MSAATSSYHGSYPMVCPDPTVLLGRILTVLIPPEVQLGLILWTLPYIPIFEPLGRAFGATLGWLGAGQRGAGDHHYRQHHTYYNNQQDTSRQYFSPRNPPLFLYCPTELPLTNHYGWTVMSPQGLPLRTPPGQNLHRPTRALTNLQDAAQSARYIIFTLDDYLRYRHQWMVL